MPLTYIKMVLLKNNTFRVTTLYVGHTQLDRVTFIFNESPGLCLPSQLTHVRKKGTELLD